MMLSGALFLWLVGGDGGVGSSPRVISTDQASLMSARSSRAIQASRTALPTPVSPPVRCLGCTLPPAETLKKR